MKCLVCETSQNLSVSVGAGSSDRLWSCSPWPSQQPSAAGRQTIDQLVTKLQVEPSSVHELILSGCTTFPPAEVTVREEDRTGRTETLGWDWDVCSGQKDPKTTLMFNNTEEADLWDVKPLIPVLHPHTHQPTRSEQDCEVNNTWREVGRLSHSAWRLNVGALTHMLMKLLWKVRGRGVKNSRWRESVLLI